MACRVNTWLFQIYVLYVAWIHDFVKSLAVTLHPPGGMIFDKHDKSCRYLTLMTVAWELYMSILELLHGI